MLFPALQQNTGLTPGLWAADLRCDDIFDKFCPIKKEGMGAPYNYGIY